MKKIVSRFILISASVFIVAISFFGLITNVLAASDDLYGANITANAAGISQEGTIQSKIGTGVGAILSLMGILFFLLALYAGFLWMTARGQAQQVEKAQGILIDAAIGLVIIGASWIITSFVFSAITP